MTQALGPARIESGHVSLLQGACGKSPSKVASQGRGRLLIVDRFGRQSKSAARGDASIGDGPWGWLARLVVMGWHQGQTKAIIAQRLPLSTAH